MLKDDRKDLLAERQKRLITRLVQELSQQDPDLYYRATSEIAARIKAMGEDNSLNGEDRALLAPLSARDVAVLLSLH